MIQRSYYRLSFLCYSNSPRREILLWKKANIPSIDEQLTSKLDVFNRTTFADVNDMWTYFKDTIQCTIKQHVPSRPDLARHTRPCTKSDWRCLNIKKQRAYTQAKWFGVHKDWRRYKSLNIWRPNFRGNPDGHTLQLRRTLSARTFRRIPSASGHMLRAWSRIHPKLTLWSRQMATDTVTLLVRPPSSTRSFSLYIHRGTPVTHQT